MFFGGYFISTCVLRIFYSYGQIKYYDKLQLSILNDISQHTYKCQTVLFQNQHKAQQLKMRLIRRTCSE